MEWIWELHFAEDAPEHGEAPDSIGPFRVEAINAAEAIEKGYAVASKALGEKAFLHKLERLYQLDKPA